jgi:predicted nucleic acid-binding protein
MELNKSLKYALDTNILIYAINENSQFFIPARQLIDLVRDQNYSIFVTDKTLYEFYAVISNLLKNSQSANDLLEKIVNLFNGKVIRSTQNTLNLVQNLIQTKNSNHKGKYIHDLVLAGICIDNSIDVLITQNTKDFENIPVLKLQTL